MKRLLTLASLALAVLSPATAKPLQVGDPAPSASAPTETGDVLELSAVYAKHPYTLVYFYPKADTPGCTKQGCSLRDAYEELTDRGVAVIGVSTDSVEAQRAFKEKYQLPFTLLADTEKKVMAAFGNGGSVVARRQAYLIHDGRIVYADHAGSTEQQAQDILQFLARR